MSRNHRKEKKTPLFDFVTQWIYLQELSISFFRSLLKQSMLYNKDLVTIVFWVSHLVLSTSEKFKNDFQSGIFKLFLIYLKTKLKSLINRLRVTVIPFFLCYQLSLLFTMGVPLVSPFPQGPLSLIFLWSVNKPKFKVSTYNQCKLMIS